MYERMLNKNEKPTAEQMASYCGATSTMFTELNEWISNGILRYKQLSFPMETTTDGAFPIREKESLSVMYFRKAVHLPL